METTKGNQNMLAESIIVRFTLSCTHQQVSFWADCKTLTLSVSDTVKSTK